MFVRTKFCKKRAHEINAFCALVKVKRHAALTLQKISTFNPFV